MEFSGIPLGLVTGGLVGAAGLLMLYLWRYSRQRVPLSATGNAPAVSSSPAPVVVDPQPAVETRREPARPRASTAARPRPDDSFMGFEEMIVQLEAEQNPEAERLEQLRRYFQEVSEQYKLPPLPMAVTTALQLVRNDYTDLRQLTRVLSNDAALAGRILSLARSPIFGLQRLPRTLQEAIPVLGLLTLRRILLAAGTQMLYAGHSKASQALWNHSLATALASQLLADRSNKSGDQAFLTGLLHDVGLMVTVHSYEAQFERLQKQLQEQQQSSLAWEHRLYHTDHTIVGAAVLYRWHLDRNTIMAVFGHHKEEAQDDPSSLESLIRMANFLAHQAGLGFLTPPVGLSQQVLEFYGCETEEEMESVCATVTRRFTEEKSLFS